MNYDVKAVHRLAERINSGSLFEMLAPNPAPEKSGEESKTIELDLETRTCTPESAKEIIGRMKQMQNSKCKIQNGEGSLENFENLESVGSVGSLGSVGSVENFEKEANSPITPITPIAPIIPISPTIPTECSTEPPTDQSPQTPLNRNLSAIVEGVGSLPASDRDDYRSAIKRGAYDHKFEDDVSATWLMEQNVEPMEYLLEPLLPKCGLVSLVGSSDSGKSSFLRGLAIAVAAGRAEHIGMPLHTRSQRVIYVSTEDDQTAVGKLLHKQNEELCYTRGQLAGLRFVFNTESLYEKLDLLLSEHTHDLVILDAFSDLYQGALNENNKVRGFLQQYHELAQRHGTLIMFLHHTGKRTESLMPSKHNSIGSQGFEAKMRLMMELRPDLHDSSLRHLCVVKGNYLPAEWKKQSFVLKFSDSLNFTNTGRREEFYRLRQLEPDEKQIEREDRYGRVMDMLAEGR
ncbi:MAG: AAA family ATPase, partial [Tidjanibacter sp.]|nr:AAA family ATPase [Tidjanibacter sp.]